MVWRKEKDATGTSVKGGCCHWMTLASPGMKVALQPVRGAMHRRSVNPNHHNSSKSKTCRMQGSTKVRSAKTAYKGYPDVNNIKCIKRSNSTIYIVYAFSIVQHLSASLRQASAEWCVALRSVGWFSVLGTGGSVCLVLGSDHSLQPGQATAAHLQWFLINLYIYI